ncbi:hypothetical protein FRC08_018589 [Ceratobasidium sp. 394]|nr:hypothetical protein FRC08_018589 [Ceratobasidium sp. 394]KAG9089360.1 hypothetical protein FS749_001399 [Ceratobasidium sp. UAMH 11750]
MALFLREIVEITKDAPDFDAYLERLVEIANLAFEHDPLNIAGLGTSYKEDPDIYSVYNKAQFEAAFTGAGRVYGVFLDRREPQKLAGFAIWYEPGKGFLEDEAQLSYWREFTKRLKPELRSWWKDVMQPRYAKLADQGLGEGVKKDLFHLQVLGVHPDFQRRGLGSALVKHTLDQSDSSGVATCLETEEGSNVGVSCLDVLVGS